MRQRLYVLSFSFVYSLTISLIDHSPYPFTPDTLANCFHTSYPPSKTTPSARWIYDTGACSHMTNNLDLFLNIEPYHKRVRYANNTSSLALGIGTVAIQGKLPNGNNPVLLQRVLCVPDLGSDNLFS